MTVINIYVLDLTWKEKKISVRVKFTISIFILRRIK